MGSEPGDDIAVSGDSAAATGSLVELLDAPLALGSIRPYQTVYGEYEEQARQSLAQQALPPALESVVRRYFSAIAPTTGPDR
jgi:hypothetical protein